MRETSAGGEKIGGSMGRGRYEWGHGQVWCDGERGYLMRAVEGRQVGGEGGRGEKVPGACVGPSRDRRLCVRVAVNQWCNSGSSANIAPAAHDNR
jgi:hypothetical protein